MPAVASHVCTNTADGRTPVVFCHWPEVCVWGGGMQLVPEWSPGDVGLRCLMYRPLSSPGRPSTRPAPPSARHRVWRTFSWFWRRQLALPPAALRSDPPAARPHRRASAATWPRRELTRAPCLRRRRRQRASRSCTAASAALRPGGELQLTCWPPGGSSSATATVRAVRRCGPAETAD